MLIKAKRRATLVNRIKAWVINDLKTGPEPKALALPLILGILMAIAVMGVAKYAGWL